MCLSSRTLDRFNACLIELLESQNGFADIVRCTRCICYCYCSQNERSTYDYKCFRKQQFSTQRKKKCCDSLLSFVKTFFKRNQGQDLYITLKTIKLVLIFLLHFSFFYLPLTKLLTERFMAITDFQQCVLTRGCVALVINAVYLIDSLFITQVPKSQNRDTVTNFD